mmetsp:Transcript_45741/g.110859  ORF Transcript_45741/g.110859 Transcript_45741/m.110859 type:complete len:706 (-) Transcript_45741:81-2198(-)
MTSNNLGGEQGHMDDAVKASDDEGPSKTSDDDDTEDDMAVKEVPQSDDDLKEVPSSPTQLLRGAVTAVMTSNSLGVERGDIDEVESSDDQGPSKTSDTNDPENDMGVKEVPQSDDDLKEVPSSPAQVLRGAVTAVMTSNSLGVGQVNDEPLSPTQLLRGAVTAVMTSNNLGGEQGHMDDAVKASDDEGPSKTSDDDDTEDDMAVKEVPQSDDDLKEVPSSPAQLLRGAVTAVMTSNSLGVEQVNNEPSSPVQLLRGAVTAVMTSNNLGVEQVNNIDAVESNDDEEPVKINDSVAAEEEVVARDVSASPNGIDGEDTPGGSGRGLFSSFRRVSERLLSPNSLTNSLRSSSSRKLQIEKEKEEKLKLMLAETTFNENEIVGGAEKQEELIRKQQEEKIMLTQDIAILDPNERSFDQDDQQLDTKLDSNSDPVSDSGTSVPEEQTESKTGKIDLTTSLQPVKATGQIEKSDAAVGEVPVSTPKSFGTPTVLPDDFLKIAEVKEKTGAVEQGTLKDFGTPTILPEDFLQLPSASKNDEGKTNGQERRLENSPELETNPPAEIIFVNLKKQMNELQEKLNEQETKTAKMEEEAAAWETKSMELEDKLVTYIGMYEDLQEDYDMVLAKYNEQVDQNATLLGIIDVMKKASSIQESGLAEKTDRIRTLEAQVTAFQQTSNTKQLVELKDENAKLRHLVQVQKESIQAALQGM